MPTILQFLALVSEIAQFKSYATRLQSDSPKNPKQWNGQVSDQDCSIRNPAHKPVNLVHHTSHPWMQCFGNMRKGVWLAWLLFVYGVWEYNPNPKPRSETTDVLTAIVFVISVRAVLFLVAHICCREAFSSLTGKHVKRAFTIVFVWFILTCNITITAQIVLDTFAIFASELFIATSVIFMEKKQSKFIYFAAFSQKLSPPCYDWFCDFPTLHQPRNRYPNYVCTS